MKRSRDSDDESKRGISGAGEKKEYDEELELFLSEFDLEGGGEQDDDGMNDDHQATSTLQREQHDSHECSECDYDDMEPSDEDRVKDQYDDTYGCCLQRGRRVVYGIRRKSSRIMSDSSDDSSTSDDSDYDSDDSHEEEEDEMNELEEIEKQKKEERLQKERMERQKDLVNSMWRSSVMRKARMLQSVRWTNPSPENGTSIQDLPDLALTHLLGYLSLSDIGSMAKTCKFMRLFIRDNNTLWSDIALNTFGTIAESHLVHDIISGETIDWRETVKKRVIYRRREKSSCSFNTTFVKDEQCPCCQGKLEIIHVTGSRRPWKHACVSCGWTRILSMHV